MIGAALATVATLTPVPARSAPTRSITLVSVIADRADLRRLGTDGSWFPEFDAPDPVEGAPTGDGAIDDLPSWIGAFNHTTGPTDPGCTEPGVLLRGCLPTYAFRTFSQDGPARAASRADWSKLRLPAGVRGRAGAIVDPQTFVDGASNANNTVNRLQLLDGTPATFFVTVVVDQGHDGSTPAEVEVRGNAGAADDPTGGAQVEPDRPADTAATADGRPDLVVYRVDGFAAGDYLKVRLRGGRSGPASFAGLLFDEAQPRGAASRSTSHTTRSATTREAGTSTPS